MPRVKTDKPSPTHINMARSYEDPAQAKLQMQTMFGPQMVDQLVRQAISMCWMMLPDDRKKLDAVESEMQRIVTRALQNMREDCKAFGIPPAESKE